MVVLCFADTLQLCMQIQMDPSGCFCSKTKVGLVKIICSN